MKLQDWYRGLPEREQRIALWGGAAAARAARRPARLAARRLRRERRRARRAPAPGPRVHRDRRAAAAADAGGASGRVADDRRRPDGARGRARRALAGIEPAANGALRARFTGASFDSLVLLLARLQKERGVDAETASVSGDRRSRASSTRRSSSAAPDADGEARRVHRGRRRRIRGVPGRDGAGAAARQAPARRRRARRRRRHDLVRHARARSPSTDARSARCNGPAGRGACWCSSGPAPSRCSRRAARSRATSPATSASEIVGDRHPRARRRSPHSRASRRRAAGPASSSSTSTEIRIVGAPPDRRGRQAVRCARCARRARAARRSATSSWWSAKARSGRERSTAGCATSAGRCTFAARSSSTRTAATC